MREDQPPAQAAVTELAARLSEKPQRAERSIAVKDISDSGKEREVEACLQLLSKEEKRKTDQSSQMQRATEEMRHQQDKTGTRRTAAAVPAPGQPAPGVALPLPFSKVSEVAGTTLRSPCYGRRLRCQGEGAGRAL